MPVHHALAGDERTIEHPNAEQRNKHGLILRNQKRRRQKRVIASIRIFHDCRFDNRLEKVPGRRSYHIIMVERPGRRSNRHHIARHRRSGKRSRRITPERFAAKLLEVLVHAGKKLLVHHVVCVRSRGQHQILAIPAITPFAQRNPGDDVFRI